MSRLKFKQGGGHMVDPDRIPLEQLAELAKLLPDRLFNEQLYQLKNRWAQGDLSSLPKELL